MTSCSEVDSNESLWYRFSLAQETIIPVLKLTPTSHYDISNTKYLHVSLEFWSWLQRVIMIYYPRDYMRITLLFWSWLQRVIMIYGLNLRQSLTGCSEVDSNESLWYIGKRVNFFVYLVLKLTPTSHYDILQRCHSQSNLLFWSWLQRVIMI